jgi:2-dehydropantoate 2-reductase
LSWQLPESSPTNDFSCVTLWDLIEGITMRFAIYGTGGAGGYFGAHLARAGLPVTFIARGEHLEVMRSTGLVLKTPAYEIRVLPAEATDDPEMIGPVDVVLLGVKAWQVRDAGNTMRPMIGPETVVIPLQNGVEATAELSEILGSKHVLTGTCGTISWVSAPGEIQSLGTANFIRFGEQDDTQSNRTAQICALMREAGLQAEVPDSIRAALWTKFLVVTAIGGLGAITRAPVGVVRSMPETRHLLEACMHEVHRVASAHGIALAKFVVSDMLNYLDGLDPTSTTSLQRDIIAGKPSELDYWTGAVVRLAAARHVPAPVNKLIYDLLLPQHRPTQARLQDAERARTMNS